MSGIGAVVYFDGRPCEPRTLEQMVAPVHHRGPDGIRFWIDGSVGLAHLALHATPEARREHQPLPSSDGLHCLTADLRLDNRAELLSLLAGHSLLRDAPTDAELLLAAYRRWGVHCAAYLVGDFALALWDSRRQTLFCARDPMGMKPLHYCRLPGSLLVASEAQQLLQHPAVPRHLDRVALADHLAMNRNDEGRTLFLGISQLPPATFLEATPDATRLHRYWDPDPSARIEYREERDYAAHFLDLLERATVDRLRTQSPTVAIAMSGGLDSCSVAAVAHRASQRNPALPRVVAFSKYFPLLRECDEREFSQCMAEELALEVEYVDGEEGAWLLEDEAIFTPPLEMPYMLWQEVNFRRLLRRAQTRGSTVLLDGHGGDNLLLGSPLVYTDALRCGHLRGVWEDIGKDANYHDMFALRILLAAAKPLLPTGLSTTLDRLRGRAPTTRLAPWLDERLVRESNLVARVTASPFPRRYESLARQELYESARLLASGTQGAYWLDRLCGHYGIEPRHPFADRRLIEYLLQIPQELLFRAGRRKRILRSALPGILPEKIRLRNYKTRFAPFWNYSLQQRTSAKLRKLLQEPLLARLGLVDVKRLDVALQAYLSGQVDHFLLPLWSTVTLELWLKEHFSALTNHDSSPP